MPVLTWKRWLKNNKYVRGLSLNNYDWSLVTSSAGVYVIYYKTKNARKVVYVGQSNTNIGTRLNDHIRLKDIQSYSHNTLYATYAVVSDSVDRDNAEAYLIHHYRPPANDYIPPDTGEITTLPFKEKL